MNDCRCLFTILVTFLFIYFLFPFGEDKFSSRSFCEIVLKFCSYLFSTKWKIYIRIKWEIYVWCIYCILLQYIFNIYLLYIVFYFHLEKVSYLLNKNKDWCNLRIEGLLEIFLELIGWLSEMPLWYFYVFFPYTFVIYGSESKRYKNIPYFLFPFVTNRNCGKLYWKQIKVFPSRNYHFFIKYRIEIRSSNEKN